MHSLPEVYASVPVPDLQSPWTRKLGAFVGVGFLISVGYMDPGNWATDLTGGASFGYTLLIVILLANFMAIFLQALSVKLGAVSERDLAQACRDAYPKWICYMLWFLAEVAIAATDLAEVIGSATALYLLSNGHLPLWAGILITSADVLLILAFGTASFRTIEVFVFVLCAVISGCFVYEIAVVKPNWAEVGQGFIPKGSIITEPTVLYNAIGILGATVMPHNLYLHSSIIQTRAYPRSVPGKCMAVKYGVIDSTLSLLLAFFVNAAILVLASAAFHYGSMQGPNVASLTQAYHLLAPALGQVTSRYLFAIALLASGQNSTVTGTLAGQVVLEGFLHVTLAPWIWRLVTRVIAIVPGAIIAAVFGNEGAGKLLVLSQVILSMQLPFAVIPLVHFTSSRRKMGRFVNSWTIFIVAICVSVLIVILNVYLIVSSIKNNEFGGASSV